MRLFLDCEFNGFGGELISMALVDEMGQYFYEVLACDQPVPWVAEHVIPHLNREPVSFKQFQSRLQIFLFQYDSLEIIADWPEDFALFTRSLILAAGKSIRIPSLNMYLWMDQPTETHVDSEHPHNALADAQALKQSYLKAMP